VRKNHRERWRGSDQLKNIKAAPDPSHLWSEMLIELRRIGDALDPQSPDTAPLLAELARVTNGDSFMISSLFKQAELDEAEGDDRLEKILTEYCDRNAGKLSRLFSLMEGPQLRRVRNTRDGWVWRLKM
jgi:hypothetical protein